MSGDPVGLGRRSTSAEYAAPASAEGDQADPRGARGYPNRGLRVFRAAFITPSPQRPARLMDIGVFQRARGRPGDGHHDRSDRRVALRGRDGGGATGLREGAYAAWRHRRCRSRPGWSCPAALSGIVAAFVLGVSRGIGETMIVLIAAGLLPNTGVQSDGPFETMTTFIGATAQGRQPHRLHRILVDLRRAGRPSS